MSGSRNTLEMFQSNEIRSEFRNNYPTLSQLLDYNGLGTVEFLKSNEAISMLCIQHEFDVGYEGYSNGERVWSEYENIINSYVEKLIQNDAFQFREPLNEARIQLSRHIHQKCLNKIPYWPDVGGNNMANVELNISSTYKSAMNHVSWGCDGMIKCTKTRQNHYSYGARITGCPDIKAILINYSIVRELENSLRQRGIQECKQMIDRTQGTRGGYVFTWETFD